ncbi:MAG TPA: type II toxin-antitoxin system VapC family toxin [Gammaproteobacteria bacterium]|nr:type II toxin-antitoxin system VapC family toxin [Gammaproteobacteria bacterium]
MRLLLDTCTFLWAVSDPAQLSERGRSLIIDPDNEVFLSVVSAWEIALKQGLGKLELSEPAVRYVPRYREALEVAELALDEASALQVSQLPTPHNDPFDRALVCQAIVHGLTILTPDAQIARYPVPVTW